MALSTLTFGHFACDFIPCLPPICCFPLGVFFSTGPRQFNEPPPPRRYERNPQRLRILSLVPESPRRIPFLLPRTRFFPVRALTRLLLPLTNTFFLAFPPPRCIFFSVSSSAPRQTALVVTRFRLLYDDSVSSRNTRTPTCVSLRTCPRYHFVPKRSNFPPLKA